MCCLPYLECCLETIQSGHIAYLIAMHQTHVTLCVDAEYVLSAPFTPLQLVPQTLRHLLNDSSLQIDQDVATQDVLRISAR
jgi:hypothetical protein